MGTQVDGAAEVVPIRDPKPADGPSVADDRTVLFISHRHEDRPIADALRKFITASTGGRVKVYQSSSPDAEGPRQGHNVTAELRRALWHASVLVLIYTTREHDWSYCMWECGVAQLPEPSDTKTIVFQCAEQFPAVFGDQLRVDVRNAAHVEKFVTELLTSPDYFPRLGRAVTEFDPGTEPVKEAAQDLHKRLEGVVDVADSVVEWPPYPQLTLELSDEITEGMFKAEGTPAEQLEVIRPLVVDGAMVVGGDSQVGRIFGVPEFPRNPSMPGVPLCELVCSWQNDTATPASRWIDALCTQMTAMVRNKFPTLRWELMRGVDDMDMTWYGPMLRYYKHLPARRCTTFDVVFAKFQLDDQGQPKIGVPEVEPDL